MKLQSFERDASIDKMTSNLRTDGAIIVENRMSSQRMAEIWRICDSVLESREITPSDSFASRARYATRLFARGREFTELLLDPVVLGLADEILLPNCNAYQVHFASCGEVWEGGQNQPLHRADDVFEPHLPYVPGDQSRILSFMWAASDFTADNGATRLVRGSHNWASEREARDEEVTQAVMPSGSMTVWLGGTIHGAAVNFEKQPRRSMLITLSLGWLRQEENQYVAVPPEIAKTLPLLAQQLIGYRAFGSALGFVDGRDPDCLLRDGEGIGKNPLAHVYEEDD